MLQRLVSERREALLTTWFERIVSGYPDETSRFLTSQNDPFHNPVGTGLRAAVGPLLDAAVGLRDPATLGDELDQVIRVRAVQEMSPSAAVGFVFDLKPIVRSELGDALSSSDLAALDSGVDRVALRAFDVYSACREQLCEIRVKAIRDQSLKVMERLNAWRARRAGDGAAEDGAPEM